MLTDRNQASRAGISLGSRFLEENRKPKWKSRSYPFKTWPFTVDMSLENCSMFRRRQGFTLIELLIVVAIIGILAAIAVPNFLNAQTRAKVARVKSELRSLTVATDSYQLDHNGYPWPKYNGRFDTQNHIGNCLELTTPVAYMSSVDLDDPFVNRKFWTTYGENQAHPMYIYVNYHGSWGNEYYKSYLGQIPKGYGVSSHGPNNKASGGVIWPVAVLALGTPVREANNWIYDPSNGLRSIGDIIRLGGGVRPPPSGGG